MNIMEKTLYDEQIRLGSLAEKLKKCLEKAPKGHLRILDKRKTGKGVEYYYKSENDVPESNGRYLRKEERKLAVELAQRDYNQRILQKTEERKKAIESFLQTYRSTELSKVYEKISSCRKALITVEELPLEDYVWQWQSKEYKGKAITNEMTEIFTERGERVRSKSEKIIADKLYLLGIPYRYECPLFLEGNVVMYPDFTILNKETREEFYLEHFGRMDDMLD